MGKLSRRNRRQRIKASNSTTSSNDDTNASSCGSQILINRIRHGDTRVRHGTLTALASTIFSSESLSSSNGKIQQSTGRRSINEALLKAMSDRIFDDDVPCAACAVGCLSNYILFGPGSNSNFSDEKSNACRIIGPILHARVMKICDAISHMQVDLNSVVTKKLTVDNECDSNQLILVPEQECKTKKKKKNSQINKINNNSEVNSLQLRIKEQWSLLSLCLRALCGLVETYDHDVENADVLQATVNVIDLSIKNYSNDSNPNACTRTLFCDPNPPTNTTTLDDTLQANKISENMGENPIEECFVYASRTIHSLMDENLLMAQQLQSLSLGVSWDMIQSVVVNSNYPALARLHCAGIIVTVRQVLVGAMDNSSSLTNHDKEGCKKKVEQSMDPFLSSNIIPLLSGLLVYNPAIAMELISKINETKKLTEDEMEDEKMELEAIQKIEKQRQIGKENKQRKGKKEKMDTAEYAQRRDKSKNNQGKSLSSSGNDRKEGASSMHEEASLDWIRACMPLKLAIEIATNLCAGSINDRNDLEDFDMNSDSDSVVVDDIGDRKSNPLDVNLFYVIQQARIPDQILSLLGGIVTFILENGQLIPKNSAEDLCDVMSKCSSCLGNALCSLPSWKTNEQESSATWKELCSALFSSFYSSGNEVKQSGQYLPVSGISALTSIMTAFIRMRSNLIGSIEENDLDIIISCLNIDSHIIMNEKLDSDNISAVSNIQRDAIIMLTSLCSKPHTHTINDRICSVLLVTLAKLTTCARVMSEILNGLMDMYSSDENDPNNHEVIFKSRHVLEVIQKSLPHLESKIKQQESQNTATNEDLEFWEETILNSKRFIQYKKEQ
mmetsp:Transcript_1742/g.2504  ORF Transcript_1742/g.2504 Transcript_1742/m.2504 type:complete len:841 (-) Transcript_1742:161-2683(-)